MGWEQVTVQDKARRYKRLAAAGRIMPEIELLCSRHGIRRMEPKEGILHFEYHEYIIVWPMSTNRITIQYRLPHHNERVRFCPAKCGKPKILLALEEVISLYEMGREPAGNPVVGSGN